MCVFKGIKTFGAFAAEISRICIPTFLLAFLASSVFLTGCAELKDKFVRKSKKEEKTAVRYYKVREYHVRPSIELYTKRYVFWKSWHRELLSVLESDNHKKTVVAAEQASSNLRDMYAMLDGEKGEQLLAYIEEMARIEDQIKKERVTRGNAVRMRRKLETLGRNIKKYFSYTKVRGSIRDEFLTK